MVCSANDKGTFRTKTLAEKIEDIFKYADGLKLDVGTDLMRRSDERRQVYRVRVERKAYPLYRLSELAIKAKLETANNSAQIPNGLHDELTLIGVYCSLAYCWVDQKFTGEEDANAEIGGYFKLITECLEKIRQLNRSPEGAKGCRPKL